MSRHKHARPLLTSLCGRVTESVTSGLWEFRSLPERAVRNGRISHVGFSVALLVDAGGRTSGRQLVPEKGGGGYEKAQP